MPRCIRLLRLALRYAAGPLLHTATSGPVAALDELRLVAEQDGALAGIGAARVNIAYLTGVPAAHLVDETLAPADAFDWRRPWRDCAATLDRDLPGLTPAVRMMFEMLAADATARDAGQPLVEYLGGSAAAALPTNQTLFLSDEPTLLARADAYVRRGFCDLKLRIGGGAFADDLRRLWLLRERFGPALRLSADANGRWTETEAVCNLHACAGLDLAYVEQPAAADDWAAMARVARAAPMPVMLDESLGNEAAVDRLLAERTAPLAHLKLARLGGLDRLLRAGRRLSAAGIGVMVGQMNEGVVSTLAAAQAAAALGTAMNELYGADGLAGDPAGALTYAAGGVALPPGPGLGIAAHRIAGTVLREYKA